MDHPEGTSFADPAQAAAELPTPGPAAARPGWWRHLAGRPASRKGLALFDQAVVSAASFGTTLLVGRVGGPDELGAYSLGFTLVLVALCVQDALVAGPYTVYGNRVQGQARAELAGFALAQQVLCAAVLATGLALTALALAGATWAGGLVPVLWVLAGALPGVLLREFGRRLAYAHFHTATALRLDAAVALLQAATLGALAAAGLLSAAAAHAAVGLACAAGGLTWLALARRRFALCRERMAAAGRQHWSFGRWLLAGQLAALAQWYFLYWLLAVRLDTTATGTFAACMVVVTVANPFILGTGNVVGPSAARAFAAGGAAAARRVVVRASRLLGGAGIVLTALAAVWGGDAVAALYGAGYAGHGRLVALLALLVPLAAVNVMADHGLRALERSDVSFLASLLSLGVALGLAWFLLGAWQLTGAAGGLLAGEAAGSLVRWPVLLRLTRAETAVAR